jgi:dihydrofolate synthase/folylpolyglutamate synthase
MLENASTAIMATQCLQEFLQINIKNIIKALKNVYIHGRCEIIELDHATLLLDVSHNPQAVEHLAQFIRSMKIKGKIFAIVGMLADKDITGSLYNMKNIIDEWHVVSLESDRAESAEKIKQHLHNFVFKNTVFLNTLYTVFNQVYNDARTGDLIVVFGSFLTVAEIIRQIDR